MDPVSATASILTLLGAAGGSCKFLFNFLHDLSDAPHDIQVQNKKLGCLYETLTALSQMYAQLPADFQSHPHLQGKLLEFAQDLGKVRGRIEVKTTALGKGRRHKVQESFKWLFFDRQLKKLFDSLDHWDMVLSQAMMASQTAICLQIKTQTSKLLARTEPNHYSHQISTRTPSYKKNYRVLITHDQYAPPVGSQSRAAVDSGTSAPSHQSNRLAQYLATIEDPVGGQYQFWYQIHSSILQVRGHTGPLVVRRWSRDGREQYAALSARDGYSGSIDFESFNFARRKLSLKIFVQYNRLNLLGLSIRLNFRASALFSFDGPHHRAIAVGDRGYLRQKLSERSLSPYDSTPNGDTLLHLAAGHGQSEIITMLVNEGADVNAANKEGETPLHICVKRGCGYESARRLLVNGADLHRQNKNGYTPLHMFYTEVVGQIMHYHREELDLSLQDRRGMTIMHWACWTRKSTPKDIANGYGSPTMAGMKHGAYSPLNIRDNCGKSILHFAVERGNIPVVELLLSTPQAEALSAADFSGCNLLHYSVASYRIQLIDFFLQRGFDLNSTDNKSRTVMHYAAMRGNLPAVKKLLDLGASHQLSLKDRDFYTPLQLAVECGSVSVAEYLQPICPLDESKALNRQEHTTRRLQHTQQSNNSDKGVSEYLKLFIRVVFVLSLVSIAGVIYSGGWGRPSTLGCTLAPTIHRTSSLQLFKR